MTKLLTVIVLLTSLNAFAMRRGKTVSHRSSPTLAKIKVGQSTCTGVRISRDYILTAAHCFRTKPGKFYVTYIHGKKMMTAKIRFSTVIIKGTELSEELAIIPINPPELDNNESPIIHPVLPYTPGDFTHGHTLSIQGFGMDTRGNVGKLREGTVSYKQDFIRPRSPKYKMMLVMPNTKNQFPCPGDSGGPIFTTKDGVKSLVGIISFIASSKGNIQRYEPQDQCRKADIASYIPLNLHMDFLERYL